MRARLGGPAAITATAHKLARIFFQLVTTRESYDESRFQQEEARVEARKLDRFKRRLEELGYEIVPPTQPCVS